MVELKFVLSAPYSAYIALYDFYHSNINFLGQEKDKRINLFLKINKQYVDEFLKIFSKNLEIKDALEKFRTLKLNPQEKEIISKLLAETHTLIKSRWQTILKLVSQRAKELAALWSEKKDKFLEKAKEFYNLDILPQEIKVLLAFSSEHGGEVLDKKIVGIRTNTYIFTPNQDFDVLIHEIMHLLDVNYNKNSTLNVLKGRRINKEIAQDINEAIVQTLCPGGIFSEYLEIPQIIQARSNAPYINNARVQAFKSTIKKDIVKHFSTKKSNYKDLILKIIKILSS